MESGTHDRGVSEVVGFILLFGMLVTAFTVYQGIIVPDQNRQVEFQHNQEVQGQMQDLRNAIVSTAATDSGQAVSVTLGASYPTRALAMNLGVSAGSLQTIGGGQGVVVRNVSTQDGQTADYVSGTLGPFPTKSIRYTPVYSFYSEAPDTVYENSLVYNRFDSANITLTDQILFDGRDVTIVTVNGSLSAAQQDTVSVNTRPISVSSTRVPVSSNGSGPVTITVPSRLSASQWEEILGEEYDPTGESENSHVTAVRSAGPNAVEFVLEEEGVDYDLRLARIGVGGGADSTSSHYLTTVSGNQSNVPIGRTQQLVVEVRDEYNNPVSGAEVNVSDGPVADTDIRAVTGADGRARITFQSETTGTKTVTMNISGSPTEREEATFVLNVQADGGGAGTSDQYSVHWLDPSTSLDNPGATLENCDSSDCTWEADNVGDRLTLRAQTDPPEIEGLTVDFGVDNGNVGSVSPSNDESNQDGEVTTELIAQSEGSVGVYLGTGGSSGLINLSVEIPSGASPEPTIEFRLDDLTDQDQDSVEFIGSYDISNINSSFQRVEVTYENTEDGSATDTLSSTSSRDGLTYTNGYGAGATYDVTVEVIYDNGDGEYVAASRTVSDKADAQNPDDNDNLSVAGSATLTSSEVSDGSNDGGPRYQIDYQIGSGSFTEVKLVAVSTESGGDKAVVTRSQRTGNNVNLNPGYGSDREFKIAILVFDGDGAVVDAEVVTDVADGSDP